MVIVNAEDAVVHNPNAANIVRLVCTLVIAVGSELRGYLKREPAVAVGGNRADPVPVGPQDPDEDAMHDPLPAYVRVPTEFRPLNQKDLETICSSFFRVSEPRDGFEDAIVNICGTECYFRMARIHKAGMREERGLCGQMVVVMQHLIESLDKVESRMRPYVQQAAKDQLEVLVKLIKAAYGR